MSWFDTPADEDGASQTGGWFDRINSFFEDPTLEARWQQRKLEEQREAVEAEVWWQGVRERHDVAEGEAMRDETPAYWAKRTPGTMPRSVIRPALRGKGVPEDRFADTFLGIAKPGDKRLPKRALRTRPVAEGCGWHKGDDKKYWTEVTSDGHLTIRIDEKTGDLKRYEEVGIQTCDKCRRKFRQTNGTSEVYRQPVSHRGAEWLAEATGIDRIMPANWKWVQGLVGRYMWKRE